MSCDFFSDLFIQFNIYSFSLMLRVCPEAKTIMRATLYTWDLKTKKNRQMTKKCLYKLWFNAFLSHTESFFLYGLYGQVQTVPFISFDLCKISNGIPFTMPYFNILGILSCFFCLASTKWFVNSLSLQMTKFYIGFSIVCSSFIEI